MLGALNDVFEMDKHDGLYFTMWYGVYERVSRELRFSTGGHPPAVLVQRRNGSARATPLTLNGMIIGAFPGTTFGSQSVTIQPSDRLYIYSDGVYEVTQPDGNMWTFEGFVETILAAGDGPVVPHVVDTVRKIRGSSEFEDDVSILEVRFAD